MYGEAGGGMVSVTMNCHYGVKRIHIDDSLLADASDDKEMLEDLIAAAVNDAVRKAEATSAERMGQFTQGMNLPAGMGPHPGAGPSRLGWDRLVRDS